LSSDGVSSDFWAYSRWRAAHRACSSALSALSTQGLLVALGVGGPRAVPATAALSWLLKDGLGRVGKVVATAGGGRSFDADLKRYRFASSLGMITCQFAEALTPRLPPSLFLPVASLASAGKAVSLATAMAVQPALHRSFLAGGERKEESKRGKGGERGARVRGRVGQGPGRELGPGVGPGAENLAEITAKAGAQLVVADNVGLVFALLLVRAASATPAAAAAGLVVPPLTTVPAAPAVAAVPAAVAAAGAARSVPSSALARRLSVLPPHVRRRLPLVVFPFIALAELGCTYAELKAVHLRHLNVERAGLVARAWAAEGGGVALSPAEAARREGIVLPPGGLGAWFSPPRWLGGGQTARGGLGGLARRWPGLFARYRDDVPPAAVLPLSEVCRTEDELRESARSAPHGARCLVRRVRGRGGETSDVIGVALARGAGAQDVLEGLLAAAFLRKGGDDIGACAARARREVPALMEALQDRGWQTERIVFSGRERSRYELQGDVLL